MSTMPMTVRVLVCDTTRAMFFQVRDAEAPWHLVNVVSHPESTRDAAVRISADQRDALREAYRQMP